MESVELCDNHLLNLFAIQFPMFSFLVCWKTKICFHCCSFDFSIFLVLLFVVSLRIDFTKILSGIEVETNERRGPPPNPVEIAVSKLHFPDGELQWCICLLKIMVYVAGFIWAEIKQLYQEGLHQYMVRNRLLFVRLWIFFILGGYVEFTRLDYKLSLFGHNCPSSNGLYQGKFVDFRSD